MNPPAPQPPSSTPQPGARPSPGAATPAAAGTPEVPKTQDAAKAAAPGDGRTPAAVSIPAAPPPPNPLAHLPFPFQGVDYAAKGYHCEATVSPDQVLALAECLDKEGLSLDTITGVDWLAENQMELVYDYFHFGKALRAVVRTRIPRDNPEVASIHKVFPGANWHERETHDFFGIRFLGHPNLTPFLLPEDATYHPLRKDFKQ